MKYLDLGVVVVYAVFIAALIWGVVELGAILDEADRKGEQEKELCIVLKHQKEAEKFLDMDCQRYVRYKQDNE
jgi:hypothetical protein